MRYSALGSPTPSKTKAGGNNPATRPKLRWLMMSGDANFFASKWISTSIEEQSESIWRSTVDAHEKSGMTVHDIVKVTQYLKLEEHIPLYSAIREKYLKGATPASTLLVVPHLDPSSRLVAVEIIAAKDDLEFSTKQ
ncbi:RidA family protein [Paraburkholderia sp. Cpub6]|uniref:RidA family protein n=1 Tax=Paraburkholderia sp. Cpub6 TaxID=2723094 RepID=UPI00160EBB9B|nr:RidA family protein [Paraburkholderia sp. Cpub6]MBB5460143.1 enamine deaminase RidA (YjgF/YER057c/UK114 family) [Paraburkholderia sp. Cpub6]